MTTITTTAAAAQAGVTVATIRTWCRRNVIAAIKQAGRWVIDTASLAHRIAIGAMRTTKGHHMSQPTGPIEIQITDEISIRVKQATIPAYGTTHWYATKLINGWETAGGGSYYSADTAEEAIAGARRGIQAEMDQDARLAAVEASVSVSLIGTRDGGIFRQLDTLTAEPLRTRDHECRTCGLDDRTCDCH